MAPNLLPETFEFVAAQNSKKIEIFAELPDERTIPLHAPALLPYHNLERRTVAGLLARVGAHVVGDHRHPALAERFTVLDGELTVTADRPAFCATDVWHDYWDAQCEINR